MSGRIFLSLFFVLGATEVLHADNVLDAKLNALKEKAQKRSRYARATLDDQRLVVPQDASDEEKALDKKIEAIEKELDQQPSMLQRQAPRPRPVVRPQDDSPANWLTPALLNPSSETDASADEEGSSWITAELARQEDLRQEKMSQEEEQALVEQRVQNEMRRNMISPDTVANGYNDSLQRIISGGSPAAKALEEIPGTPQFSGTRSQSRPQAPNRQRLSESSPSLFLFPGNQTAETTSKRSSSFLQRPEMNLELNRNSFSTVSRPRPNEEDPEPIRRRINPAARSRETNPFEEDWAPIMKKSIWD
jgi:hypothetical protein